MEEKDPSFEKNVKKSFSKVKEDVFSLKEEIKTLKDEKLVEKHKIDDLNEKISQLLAILSQKEVNSSFSEFTDPMVSDGHARTQANMHANMHAHEHTNTHANLKSKGTLEEAEGIFSTLTKKEILLFLTIAQLEDEGIQPTYDLIAKKLKMTQGCVRGYLCAMIKKGTPVHKEKLRNNISLLSIKPLFKDQKLRSQLVSLYYQADPSQKSLLDRV